MQGETVIPDQGASSHIGCKFSYWAKTRTNHAFLSARCSYDPLMEYTASTGWWSGLRIMIQDVTWYPAIVILNYNPIFSPSFLEKEDSPWPSPQMCQTVLSYLSWCGNLGIENIVPMDGLILYKHFIVVCLQPTFILNPVPQRYMDRLMSITKLSGIRPGCNALQMNLAVEASNILGML